MIKVVASFILFACVLLPTMLPAQNCNEGSSTVSMDINNVKTTLSNGGEIWFRQNGGAPAYEIPKGNQTHSIFAGSMWIGGIDQGSTLRMAAQTYRQNGSDFWPGPLDNTGSTDQASCNLYDRHWKVNYQDILTLQQLVDGNNGLPISTASVPQSILEWPAKGNIHAKGINSQSLIINYPMAPFVDADSNGIYDPTIGDYPDIIGDQGVFWVYNDNGNTHTETAGNAIGIEIHALAYAFSTSNFLNNTTFYRFKLINKGSYSLDSTYMGIWVDTDLGCFNDDFIGCDPTRNLAITYNGVSNDNTCASMGYGANPPILGIQMLDGAFADLNDGIDNDGDNLVDEGSNNMDDDNDNQVDEFDERERLGMTGFITYDNDFTTTGNPENPAHYYYYLSNRWKDGSLLTEGGDGYGGNTPTQFLYDGDPSRSIEWSECSANNIPGDRRMMLTSGPFTFESGSIEWIDFSVLWNRTQPWTACSSFDGTLALMADSARDHYRQGFDDTPDTTTTVSPGPFLPMDIVLYPNPAEDWLNITLQGHHASTITLFNLNGSIVLKKESAITKSVVTLPLTDLPAGIYVLQVKTESQEYYTKVVKQ